MKEKSFWVKHKKALLILALASIVFYMIIWLLFRSQGFIPSGYGLEKRDWLGFLSGYLTLIGSLIIGYFVYLQGKTANEMNKRLLEIEDRRHKFETYPSLAINGLALIREGFVTNGFMMKASMQEESKSKNAFIFKIYNATPTIVIIQKPELRLLKDDFEPLVYQPVISAKEAYDLKKLFILPGAEKELQLNFNRPVSDYVSKAFEVSFEIVNYINERFECRTTYAGFWELATSKSNVINYSITRKQDITT